MLKRYFCPILLASLILASVTLVPASWAVVQSDSGPQNVVAEDEEGEITIETIPNEEEEPME